MADEPLIDAPTPGGSSPREQTPTGFSGPMPGVNTAVAPHTGRASPIPDEAMAAPADTTRGTRTVRQSLYGIDPAEQVDMISRTRRRSPVGWTAEGVAQLEDIILPAYWPGIAPETVQNVSNVITAASDQSIMDLSHKKFMRHVGMTTQEMFEERALMGMLGAVGDDEAFNQAAYDEWLDTGGAARDAGVVLADGAKQRFWFDNTFLESDDVRNRITGAAAPIVDATARQAALDNGFMLRKDDALVVEIGGLRGKAGVISVSGNELAIQFQDEDADRVHNVLVYLDPDTEIETREDAILAYLLADKGSAHTLAESSDDVPGRQTIAGVMIEGFDNVWAGVERNGVGQFMETVKDSQVVVGNLLYPPSPTNPNPDQDVAVEESIREKQTRAAVEQNVQTDSIVAIVQRVSAENPDMSTANIVTAGFAGWGNAPEELKEAEVVSRIEDLETAATLKNENQSMLGRFIEEDVAPPVLDALATWDAGLHIVGMAALDITNNGVLEFGREVNEKGLSALYDPESLAKLAPVDQAFIEEQFQNVREEGLPKAIGAYGESLGDIGTVANYYGIDEESALASWVNMGASVLFDPITWLTLGGNASWNAMKKGVFTAAGANRIMQSRPMLSAARNLVVNDSIRILPLLSEGGMSSNAIARLGTIAKTTYKTRAAKVEAIEQALDIMKHELPGHGGLWIPAGPARALRRKTTEGLASLSKLAPKDPQAMGLLQQLLVRAPKQRFAYINERQWLDDMFTKIQVRRLNNVDGFADDIDRFTTLYEAYRGGDGAISILQGNVQRLRKEMVELGAGLADEVRNVPRYRRAVNEWNQAIASMDELIEGRVAAGKTAAASAEAAPAKLKAAQDALDQAITAGADKKTLKTLQDEVAFLQETPTAVAADTTADQLRATRSGYIQKRDEHIGLIDATRGDATTHPYDFYTSEIGRRDRFIRQYEAQITSLGTGSRDRSILERAVHEYMDEWAEEWGVPLLKVDGKEVPHPMFEGIYVRDWDEVLGEGGASAAWVDQVSNLKPFGPYADEMKIAGFGPVAGTTPLPVDVNTFVSWHAMTGTKLGKKAWSHHAARKRWKFVGDQIQSVWALQVLFNPRTAFRSHMDEIIRFYEDAGLNPGILKTTTPSWMSGPVGAPARGFARDQMDSFVAPAQAAWDMVDPSKKGQWVAAERWVNGQVVSDPLFQGYARAFTNGADDTARRAIFEDWWNKTGAQLAKKSTIEGTELNATTAYNIIENGFDYWLSGVKETAKRGRLSRDEIRSTFLRQAADDKPVEWGPKMWRQLPQVPGEQVSRAGIANPIEGGFSLMYGKPQSRRGSVFFDHYYDWAYNNYQAAYKGKVISADWLLDPKNKTGIKTKLHAQEVMSQGHRSHVIRDLIRESGMVVETDLKNAAMQWAASSADDMMYTFGAGSILGKGIARVYPFGRAQVDYMQWWWTKLMQPTQWGVMGTGKSMTTPVIGGAARMASLPAKGANIRLIDRMAHLAKLGEPGERPGTLTPAGVVNNFSFLPTTVDEQVLIETTPNFGPLPSWLLNAPLDDTVPGWTEMRNIVQELHPAHRIFTDPSDDPIDWILAFRDTMFPKGGLSVRNIAAAMNDLTAYAVAAWTLNYDPRKPLTDEQQRRINKTANAWVLESSQGAWRADYVQLDQAAWLDENALTGFPDDNPDGELMIEWAYRNDQASVAALGEEGKDFAGKIAGVPEYSGSDFQYVETLLPVGADGWVDSWYESGSITEEKRDAIKLGYELMQNDNASAGDRLAYADEVLDAVFHFLTDKERTELFAKNSGMHVNMVSSYEVVPALVPADARDAVDGYRIRTDLGPKRAKEVRAQGKTEGWLRYRDSADVRMDSLYSAHRTFRSYLDDIYEDATGIEFAARSVVDGDERVGLDEFAVTLTPEWWDRHGAWLEKTERFQLPADVKSRLIAGMSAQMVTSELRELTRRAKTGYAYRLDVSSATTAKLATIGLNSTPASNLVYELGKVEGYDPTDFDASQDMSYYGQGLMDDFADALEAGQERYGYDSFEDWEDDYIAFEAVEKDEFGENVTVVKTYSKSNLTKRFRTAIALSEKEGDILQYSLQNHMDSIYGRELGDPNWQAPEFPPLSETVAYHETTPDNITIVDGDTLQIAGEEQPVYVRLIGLNAPEKTQPGYHEAYRGLDSLIQSADNVQLAIFDPETLGVKHTTLTREPGEDGELGPIVHRDRLLVVLYINGVPVYDAEQFSPTNVRGVGTGGNVPPYRRLYEQNGGS